MQFFVHLQEVINKYPEEFAGKASTTDTVANDEEAASVDEANEENEMMLPGVINGAGNEVLV
ncbi:hypothetical protein PF003_g30212 [Phytophthora fragariae]|nr:hypothetical protein PF003_g30212 [Phytophthora fragariae]